MLESTEVLASTGLVVAQPEDRVFLPSDGTTKIAAPLAALSANAVMVTLPRASAQTFARVGRLASVSLLVHGDTHQLEDLVVRYPPSNGGRCVEEATLELEVVDPGSRARLWNVWDRLCHENHRIPPREVDYGEVPARGHYSEKARRERLRWIRGASGAALGTLDSVTLDVSQLTSNAENVVGTVEIPVGLAGPLLFDGAWVKGRITAPLATTEGALIASASRGARAITRGDGVRTQVLSQRMSRAPVYEFTDLDAAVRFGRWIDSHLPEITEETRLVSQHAKLVEVRSIQIGRVVNLRFNYETGDAAGQNMTTTCTWRACQWINEAIKLVPDMGVRNFRIEGNASGDKKVNYLSILGGRGIRVTAECFLSHDVVVGVLKTTPQAIADTCRYGILSGIQSGMTGQSINVANLVAGMFTATGQDIACVHESSVAILSVDAVDGGLYASILLPALIVGTVGGGTNLPNQRDYLEMMGCAGEGKVERLAEIIAGFALALDLSTAAAVSGGQFADGHERLGRNRPVAWFTRNDLQPAFFTPMLAAALDEPSLEVERVTELSPVTGESIISEVTGQGLKNKLTGLLRLRLQYATGARKEDLDVVAKIKPLDTEVILATNRIASLCGGRLADLYPPWRDWTGFKDVHTRELGLYLHANEQVRAAMPRLYGTYHDEVREAFVLVMEDLGADVVLKDTINRSAWSERHVDAVLHGIALVHASWLGRVEELERQPWLGRHQTAQSMLDMAELWLALADHNATEYPEWIDEFILIRMKRSIEHLDVWWPELEAMPRTLVHNDLNPRNLALRAKELRLVAYDWELATIHLPQRDLAEFLAFTLPLDVTPDRVEHHLGIHRLALERAAGVDLDPQQWRRGYELALRDFTLTRLQLYMMAHTQRRYAFLDELVRVVKRLVRIEGERELALDRSRGARREM